MSQLLPEPGRHVVCLGCQAHVVALGFMAGCNKHPCDDDSEVVNAVQSLFTGCQAASGAHRVLICALQAYFPCLLDLTTQQPRQV
jgi:hypothetical protein